MGAAKLLTAAGGSVTLDAASTATDKTITVPAVTGTVVLQNASNNLLMNSGYGSDAVAYGCRAWVNFNGTGTVAIRSSGNVSSITDVGTGTYTINFSTAMPDTNYACVGSAVNSSSYYTCITSLSNGQTTDIPLRVTTDAGSLVDPNFAYFAIFR